MVENTLNKIIKKKEQKLNELKKIISIESLKEKKAHISLSAGNTGALLIISRLLIKTIAGSQYQCVPVNGYNR